MAAITKPTETSLLFPGGTGPLKNIPVKRRDIEALVDRLNSLSTADNSINLSGDLTIAGTTTINGALVLGDAAADAITISGTITTAEPINYSNATGIIAFATGGQASGTALTEEVNNVTTVTTAGDSVVLPSAVAGLHVYVKNSGAAALDIFPATSDSIDELAVNLAIRILPNASVHFYAKSAVVWESSIEASEVRTSINIGTDVTLAKEVNHSISVTATSTAATVGGTLALTAADGATSGNGGPLTLAAGVGGTTGVGGIASLISGAGGSTSGNSGAALLKSGATTAATAGTAGNSGTVTVQSGAPGTATTGTAGNGGSLSVTGAAGGAASGAAGIGGTGGSITLTTGAGGASASATGGVPGISGAVIIISGNGGAAAGTGVAGGAATACSITTGTGGASTHASGGAGGAGAALTVTAGNGGAVTNAAVAGGVGGAVAVIAGNAGAGSTAGSNGGAVTLTGGNGVGTAGIAGNITLTPGTTSVTTVAPTVIASTAIIQKNTTAPFFLIGTTPSDGAFAKALVGGYVEIRGATGNVQMPTAAQIVTAIGSVTAGTRFEFVLNAIGATPMTAANTATVTANTGLVINASVGHTLMTITGTSNVQIGKFAVMFDSATTCILSREA